MYLADINQIHKICLIQISTLMSGFDDVCLPGKIGVFLATVKGSSVSVCLLENMDSALDNSDKVWITASENCPYVSRSMAVKLGTLIFVWKYLKEDYKLFAGRLFFGNKYV